MSASSELTGWKEVAACLGRSVRSVQRYERELGLPVHRIRTTNGQSVYAFRQEIDAWRQARERRGGMSRQVEPAAASGPTASASRPSVASAALAGAVAGGLMASMVLWMVLTS